MHLISHFLTLTRPGLAASVVDSGYGVIHFLLILCQQLRRTELVGELVNRSSEVERNIIGKVHWGAGIAADVEGLVDDHEQRNRVLDALAVYFLAIHCQYARSSFARARAILFEVEYNRVFAGIKRRTSPAEAFQV